MATVKQVDVLIVGAGPAGSSTALHLLKIEPGWAGRITMVDKAVHPREKLCGGGVTQLGERVLAGLGLNFEPPHLPVREVRLRFGQVTLAVRDDPVFRVVRRDRFDQWLVQQAEQQGVAIRQGEGVIAIRPRADFVEVVTEQATFRAQTLVAADGSRSFVRRKLNWTGQTRMARLLEVLTPEQAEQSFEFRNGVATFDFSPMAAGLQGYYWDFPSLVEGRPFMNRGVFDSRARPERPRAPLKETLQAALAERQRKLEDYPLKGHPIHWFDPGGEFARPRILLAGDAAGVDPLLGEGISFALAYGEVAAAAIAEAFACRDFGFAGYRRQILAHPILAQLNIRTRLARLAYRFQAPWLIKGVWQAAPWIIRGLARYNPDYVPIREPHLVRVS